MSTTSQAGGPPRDSLEALLPLALELTAALSEEEREPRLIELVQRALPCDAVALLRLDGAELVPVAFRGFTPDFRGRRFLRAEHPRLDVICSNPEPTRFAADDALPDPYDGLVDDDAVGSAGRIHSCLGCPLRVGEELVGVLTADALDPGAFDRFSDSFLTHLAALAAAALRTNRLIATLERHAEQQGQVVRALIQETTRSGAQSLLGESPAMERLRRDIALVAPSEFPVLVLGETGVGKELVVQALHGQSARADRPLVYVNCAALAESVIESELFGHTLGAFTGAVSDRPGKFAIADGASLFLDEIGELPLSVQPKLLRVLQEGEIQRVGADEPLTVDVRVFAATNRDLEKEVKAGRFRADLLHRLDVCRVRVPSLRERKEDLPLLAGHFADRGRSRLGTGPVRLTREARERLLGNAWLGNVRELENAVYRAILRGSRRVEAGEDVVLLAEDFEATEADPPAVVEEGPRLTLKETVERTKRRLITEAVERNEGNWAAAARDLGLGRANLHHLARRLGLKS